VFGTLDASHDRGFKQINNGIARHLLHAAYKPAAACGHCHMGSSVATGLLKISPDFLSKKNKNPYKEKSSNLQIPPKLTPKCCIILL